ncbi:ejaculatory bulb-specific protein 3 [Bicyclus anynana]|uniref:Ejaculatory bulb-specific protein 3 n=1 Tax=Bicyclus anynana TaxID=110368 RepID=A0A6J1NBV3_BICAN|nr:ejaculatory bulb-specific protein 3 [Bicyclus anynana]
MKTIVLFALVAVAAVKAETYVTADDDLDMKAVVADLDRLVRYLDCFMDRAPCSVRTASYKKIIADSIATGCAKCNNAQKRLANDFISGIKAILPLEYFNFRLKYDPEGKHFDDFEKIVHGY